MSDNSKIERESIRMSYEGVASSLVDRILALMPEHPELVTMDDPWQLFKVPGFQCDDLGPSLAQAGWALRNAQARWTHRVSRP